MDGEINYESDISESWSLIDVNLKEPINALEAYLSENPGEYPSQEVHNVNLDSKSENSSQKAVQEEENNCGCFGKENSFYSNLHHGSTGKEIIPFCKQNTVEDRNLDEKNCSWDSESIEVIEEERNDTDADFNISVIHDIDLNETTDYSYGEESCYSEDSEHSNKDSCLFGVKRRKRQKRLSKNSINCLHSDIKHFDEELNIESSADKKNNFDLQVQMFKSNESIYSSYDINLRNALFSLSLGILFAGITCIVLSCFLGVSDVDSASDNLIQTVKKLQMEKFVLQSRFSRLNRALVRKEADFQLEELLREKRNNWLVKKQLKVTESDNIESSFFPKSKNTSILNSIQNSIQWLGNFQNLIEEKKGHSKGESAVDLNRVINFIHNQVGFLNGRYKEAKLKRTEGVNEKILKILQKILTKLSSLHDNVEILYQKLLKLIKKLNKNFNEIFTEEKILREDGATLTQQDLSSVQWNGNPSQYNFNHKESVQSKRTVVDSVLLYQFPEQKKYYSNEKCYNSDEGEIIPNNIFNSSTLPVTTDNTSSKGNKTTKKIFTTKNVSENNLDKNKNKKSDKFYRGKRENINKEDAHNRKKEKNFHKSKKMGSLKFDNYSKRFQKIQSNVKSEKNNFGLFNNRWNANKLEKNSKKKKKLKNYKENNKAGKKLLKNLRLHKIHFQKKNSENFVEKTNYKSQKYESKYFNQTGFWNFKRANGREQFRRHQTLGDWQFDRARARTFSRSSDGDWQFERARARRKFRNEFLPLNSWYVWIRQERV